MGAPKGNTLDECIRQEEHAWDALEGIKAEEECIHTPDMLEFVGMEQSKAGIVLRYRCSCGKEIEEIANLQAVTETMPVL
jgi:hypothetical protein